MEKLAQSIMVIESYKHTYLDALKVIFYVTEDLIFSIANNIICVDGVIVFWVQSGWECPTCTDIQG